MRHSRIIAFLLLFVCSTDCAPQRSGSARESAFSRIDKTKTLRVGYIVFPPCVTKDASTQKIGGHFTAAIEEIARSAGWNIEYVEADWATFPAGLSSGRFDVSISPTFVTVPRALAVSFTRPLFYAGNSAIVRVGEK